MCELVCVCVCVHVVRNIEIMNRFFVVVFGGFLLLFFL